MSKESMAIMDASQEGQRDKRSGKGYINPYKKNSQRDKYRAYKAGYDMGYVDRSRKR